MHACMHAYIHTCIHTYMHAYIHTHIACQTQKVEQQQQLHRIQLLQHLLKSQGAGATDLGQTQIAFTELGSASHGAPQSESRAATKLGSASHVDWWQWKRLLEQTRTTEAPPTAVPLCQAEHEPSASSLLGVERLRQLLHLGYVDMYICIWIYTRN